MAGMPQMSDEEMMEAVMGGTGKDHYYCILLLTVLKLSRSPCCC